MNKNDLISLIVQRGWLSVSGFVTILILPATISVMEQGLFFTFLSIAALQSIFEAGVTTVFVNYCAHEKARYDANDAGGMASVGASERLAEISSAARRWFAIVAVGFVLVVGAGGLRYLATSLDAGIDFERWQLAYGLLIVAVGASLANLGRISVLEGWGHMGGVARIRFRANLLSAATLWVALAAGFGVWALSLSYAVQSVAVVYGTSRLTRLLPVVAAGSRHGAPVGAAIDWRRDILPLQTRLGISYFCGYLVSQAIVPFALRYYGAAQAGRIGFANAIFSAAASVLASLVYLSGPRYAEQISLRRWDAIVGMFRRTTALSLAAGVVGYAGLVLVLVGVGRYWTFFAGRLPEIGILLALAVIGVANLYVGSAATLLRAFKQEPMLPVSVGAALLYGAAMVLSRHSGPDRLFLAVTIAQVAIIVPLTMVVKRRFLARVASD